MSIVTNAAETTDATEPQDGQPSAPRLVMLDPHQVEPEDNIRWNVDLDKDFVASVRHHGVLLPVRARTDADGKILIRDGRRRLMAARETGQQLPVFLVDATDEKAERIIEQHATNKHRRGLSTAEEVDVWQQLSLEGMSSAKIARTTGTKRADVDAGLAVAAHENASKAVAEYDLTLDQAAVLIQLEDDPDAVEELREVAESDPTQFDHLAQELLDAKATKEEVAKLRADYEANGVTVVDWPSASDPDVAFLYHLRAADGSHLTEENYAGQPGYAIALDEGDRGSRGHAGGRQLEAARPAPRVRSRLRPGRTDDRTEEKAERRVVVANNKAWASAEKVRRGWVNKLLSSKKLPTDAASVRRRRAGGGTLRHGACGQQGPPYGGDFWSASMTKPHGTTSSGRSRSRAAGATMSCWPSHSERWRPRSIGRPGATPPRRPAATSARSRPGATPSPPSSNS